MLYQGVNLKMQFSWVGFSVIASLHRESTLSYTSRHFNFYRFLRNIATTDWNVYHRLLSTKCGAEVPWYYGADSLNHTSSRIVSTVSRLGRCGQRRDEELLDRYVIYSCAIHSRHAKVHWVHTCATRGKEQEILYHILKKRHTVLLSTILQVAQTCVDW